MNGRRKISLFAMVFAFSVAGIVSAQEDAHGRGVEEILQQIIQVQGVDGVSEVDANAVDRDLLEELGDGVMGLMIEDEEQHEWMDRMMGGEGSSELAYMHARLGYNYLQNDGNLAAFGPGMMGYGMMGPSMMWGWNRGEWDRSTPFGWWTSPILWITGLLLLVLLSALVIVLVRTRTPRRGSEGPLAILQTRYARGELSQEEYRRMKTELR